MQLDKIELESNSVEQEKEEKRGRPKQAKVDREFHEDTYVFEKKKYQDNDGVISEKIILLKQYNNHLGKCLYRTCKEFDTNEQTINDFLSLIGNKKVDGIYVRDLVGRFGFFKGAQFSRTQLASKYNVPVDLIESATDRVRQLIKAEDHMKAYRNYFELTSDDTSKEASKLLKESYIGV